MFSKHPYNLLSFMLPAVCMLVIACSSEEIEPLSDEQQRLSKVEQSEARFYDIIENNPNSPEYKPVARVLAEEYRMFADRHESHEKAAEMMFRAANIKADVLEEYGVAVGLFRQINRRWPDTEQAERALFLAGYTYNHVMGQHEQAELVYQEFLATYPESELRQAVEDELQYMGTDFDELLRNFEPNEEL